MARIKDYRFGHVVVDGEEQRKDVIVLPMRTVRRWRRIEGHRLTLEDLDDVLDELPEHLIVGTGAAGLMRVDPDAVAALAQRGVTVEAMPSAQAVMRYADLDPSSTAIVLHLTC